MFSPSLFITVLAAIGTNAVSLPGCQQVAPAQKTLDNVRTAFLTVPNSPFGITYAKQKNIAFVSLARSTPNDTNLDTLGVLNTTTFPPTLQHSIQLPSAYTNKYGIEGLAQSHDGKDVFLCSGPGLIAINSRSAIEGASNAVVGTLNGTTPTQNPGHAAIEVTLTQNDSYAFVSQEYGPSQQTPGNIDVFHLHRHAHNKSVTATPVGTLNLSHAVVGTTLSPSGQHLYATSETTTANDTTPGTLSVIDVPTLQTNPSAALLSTAPAACGPVRVIVSSSGKIAWLTARESNHLLAYNTTKLITDPDNALIASVQVGTSPVGLLFVRNETRILTADSNRFGYANATTGISVVDVEGALAGRADAVLGSVPAGGFPRELTLSSDGRTVLVANFESNQVQAVDVGSLP